MSSSVGVTGDSDAGKSLGDVCLQKNRCDLFAALAAKLCRKSRCDALRSSENSRFAMIDLPRKHSSSSKFSRGGMLENLYLVGKFDYPKALICDR